MRAENEINFGKNLATVDPEAFWGWKTPAGRLRFARRAAWIAKWGGLKPGQNVLEIGCGTGGFTEIFAQTGARITAVDISPDLLALARARNLPAGNVEFLQCRFEDCGELGPFDAVIGSSILHHLDLQPALARIFELLKPGGWISFAEPNYLNPQIFLERKLPFIRSILKHLSPDETAIVRFSFRDQLARLGYTQIEITPLDWLHPHLPPRLIPGVGRLEKCLEQTALLREFAGSVYIRAQRPA